MLMLFVAILIVGAVYVLVPVMVSEYGEYLKPRDVICPQTKEPAVVTVNARYAALTSAIGAKSLRLAGCSQWPQQSGCDRSCLNQLPH